MTTTSNTTPIIATEIGVDRARRVRCAPGEYWSRDADQPIPAEDIISLLSDIRHYCDVEGLTFAGCVRVAHALYRSHLAHADGGGR